MAKPYAKTPTVYQMEATECGAASLAMILGYYGRHEPLEKLRVDTGVSRDGCNAKNILRAARKYGLACKGYSKSLQGLLQLRPPCIIHWNFNHFVVFEGVRGRYMYINDPASGRTRLSMEDLDDGFTGVVLTFEKTDGFTRSAQKRTLGRFIRDRLDGQAKPVLALFILGLFLVFPGLVIPVFTRVFVDDILLGGNRDWITALLVAMAGSVLLQATLTLARGLLLEKLQNKMALVSAHGFLSHMFRLPISFFDQRYAGDLSNRVENNENVSSFLAGELAETVLNILVALFYVVLLFSYSAPLACIGLVSVGGSLLMAKASAGAVANASIKQQQDTGKMLGALYSGLSITSTLKASGAENTYVQRILGFYAKCVNTEQRLGLTRQALEVLPQTLGSVANILVLMLGGIFIAAGSMTAGMLIAFTAMLDAFMNPVEKLVGMAQQVQTLKADMGRVDDIMNYTPDAKFTRRGNFAPLQTKLRGDVGLSGVSFGYSELDPPLIEDFSFALPSGHSIAIVGASGSGKSTVSKLVSGLYRPWAGQVLADGIPLPDIPPAVVASSVSTVSQSITLFTGTVRDNLTMWNKSVMEQDLLRAAKDACIHNVITQKPGAYDYLLSENGRNFSGGQRQRLEIARALVTNPSVLIMDEATSSLDPLVEKQILDNIKRRGCTCIIVAHRISAIRDCDEIIVMQGGKIVQRGTHEALLRQKGHYQRLLEDI